MKQTRTTIVLAGGGSGGHITPILPLAHELKRLQPSAQVVYIGHKGDNFKDLNLSTADFEATYFISAGKFRRYHGESVASHLLDVKTLLLNIRDFFRLFTSTLAAIRILRKLRPQVVFSKGSFVAVPVGIAARLLRIPLVTHDSDTLPGLANRLVGRWAVLHATGMPTKYYSYPKDKVVYTGTPLNPDIKKISPGDQAIFKQAIGFPPNSKVLLVGGAGNGSQLLNNLTIQAAPKLLSTHPGLHIIHFAGQKHEANVKQIYSSELSDNELERVGVYGFKPDFYKFVGAADVIVSRAGATALAEFATQSKACIIIPSPFLAGGHQLKNAQVLKDSGAATVLGENVQPAEFLKAIQELIDSEPKRDKLAANLSSALAQPQAATKIAQILLDITANTKAT